MSEVRVLEDSLMGHFRDKKQTSRSLPQAFTIRREATRQRLQQRNGPMAASNQCKGYDQSEVCMGGLIHVLFGG